MKDDKGDRLVEQACACLILGHPAGALARCQVADRVGKMAPERLRHIKCIASAYLSGEVVSDRVLQDAEAIARSLSGGQGLAELAVLHLRRGDEAAALRLIDMTIAIATRQHGVLVATQPTSVLELATFAADRPGSSRRLLDLVNIALGHRAVFTSLDDVQRLANLLKVADPPYTLWADWCEVFVNHIRFATHRPRWFAEELQDEGSVQWALEQDEESESVLRGVLQDGPPGLRDLCGAMAVALDADGLADVLPNLFPQGGAVPTTAPAAAMEWCHCDSLRFRFFWHDMVTPEEQAFLLNGEWAFFRTPSTDYSMALAQWWRILESVLKRGICAELAGLFQQHPEWLQEDQANLSPAKQKEEELFLKKLTDPTKASRLTLGDLLLILKKCSASREELRATGSRLRLEASRHLGNFEPQLNPLLEKSWLYPTCLTEANIAWYRNRASHQGSIDLGDALAGRAIAKGALNRFFLPGLRQYGLVPRLFM
jgi:hypothetical protein